MKMKNIINSERPRERILAHGASSLSDTELLAIMLGSGTKAESVLELSARLINEYGLKRLLDMSYQELIEIKGIGIAKATILLAAFELSKRTMHNVIRPDVSTPERLFNFVKKYFINVEYEKTVVVLLDIKSRVIATLEFSNGFTNKTNVSFRNIAKEALNRHAYGISLAHNHPSGDLRPSNEDIFSTINLKSMLASIDVRLFDHIIVSANNYFAIPLVRLNSI